MKTIDPSVVTSHADRPITRQLLPFRIENHNGRKYLHYHNDLEDGQHQPMSLEIGDPEAIMDRKCFAIGVNIWRLMRMYWDLEDEKNGWLKERDELLTRLKVMEGDLTSEKARSMNYEHRYNEMKKGTKKNGG